jgi:FtsZ-binding cell division protein ZapB
MAVKASSAAGLEVIDRLEEKVRHLISAIERLRADHARLAADNQRLGQEYEAARVRLADAERLVGEAATWRDERELIRARVGEMLEQIENVSF